jgi:hypothetical protein
MEEFFQACLAFPTVAFSLLLGLVLVYWLFVMVGALPTSWRASISQTFP